MIGERTLSDGSTERRRFMLQEGNGKLSAQLGGKLWHGDIVAVSAGGSASSGGLDSDLTAQFPGKIRKILVKAGDRVEEGASLLFVEAMKMEFSVKAPFSGRVSKVHVQEGQQVSPGDRFLDLERESPNA